MRELNIVLVEPRIPQNVGNIARTCAATGVRLHLIKPLGFEVDSAKLKRAGLDYWHLLDVTYYENTDDFFEKNPNSNCYFFTTKANHRHSDVSYPNSCFLVFGREDKGLPEELILKYLEHSVRIPMMNEARSLNLSNAVAVAVYETLRQWDYPDLTGLGKFADVAFSNLY